MLYNFNGFLLNTNEIMSVQPTKGQKAEYPFVLTVTLRNGQQFSVSYKDETTRRRELHDIQQLVNRSMAEPVTRFEIETIVSRYTDKIRSDLRNIKKLMKEGEPNE